MAGPFKFSCVKYRFPNHCHGKKALSIKALLNNLAATNDNRSMTIMMRRKLGLRDASREEGIITLRYLDLISILLLAE